MNRRSLLLSALLPLALGLARPAAAIDDRENISPTAWQIRAGQTGADIGNTVATGYRIVDLKIDDPLGSRFTVTYVHNSGSYGAAWWYLINVDAAGLSSFVSQNKARITRLCCWDGGASGTRFGVVMVPNTGGDAKTWWYYFGTTAQAFFNSCMSNNARPVSIDEYRLGTSTYFAGVMISNTGADARPWWFYFGQSFANVGSLISSTGARLYALHQNPSGSFNLILSKDNVGPWWYWGGGSGQQILDLAALWGARVYDLQLVGGNYNALFIRNDNALERRVGDVMRGASDGLVGVYLKRVNGATLASLNGDRVFEPASTIKTLIHYHAMNQVRQSLDALTNSVTVQTATNGSCPQSGSPVSETLQTVLQKMMENSDNNRTKAADDRFGRASINATATALAMSGTAINHVIGCGGPTANQLTLADVGRLHEAVANGNLGTQRNTFYSLMLEFGDNYAGGELNNVLAQEAAAVGLSAAQLAAFRTACRQAFKGGSYTFLGPTREYRSWATWISLPFYTSAGIVGREYVSGSFVDAATNGTNAGTAFNKGAAEVLREEIHAAMQSWKDHVAGYFATFGTGCRGTNNLIPTHSGTALNGEPNIGTPLTWSLRNARTFTPAVFNVGFSRTVWGGYALPLSLTFIGMTGCNLYVSIDASLGFTTSSTGSFDLNWTMPNVPALIGLHTYSQSSIVDVGANQLGVVTTNALDTVAGGNP